MMHFVYSYIMGETHDSYVREREHVNSWYHMRQCAHLKAARVWLVGTITALITVMLQADVGSSASRRTRGCSRAVGLQGQPGRPLAV